MAKIVTIFGRCHKDQLYSVSGEVYTLCGYYNPGTAYGFFRCSVNPDGRLSVQKILILARKY